MIKLALTVYSKQCNRDTIQTDLYPPVADL